MIGTNVIAYSIKQHLAKAKSLTRKRRRPYNHPKQLCLGARILDEIDRRGGMTSTQIKKQLFEWANPELKYTHDVRGWWSSPLYGGKHSKHGDGLLKHFCTKQGKRWVRNSVPHDDRPFTKIARKRNPWTVNPVFDVNTNQFIIQAAFNP